MTAVLLLSGRNVSAEAIADVAVDAGREDIAAQPDATVLTATLDGLPDSRVGDTAALFDAWGHQLFTGRISDLRAEQAVKQQLDGSQRLAWTTAVTAVGPLALLGQAQAGAGDAPQESDSRRILRILAETPLAGWAVIEPGIPGPDLLPRPAEPASAADLARAAADDGMGVLWEHADGTIRYTPWRLRQWRAYQLTWGELGMPWTDIPPEATWSQLDSALVPGPAVKPPEMELDPVAARAELTFEESVGDLARTITVTYGTAPDDGPRPTSTAGDGPPVVQIDTDLAEAADAATHATAMLRRHYEPAWRLTTLRIELHRLRTSAARQLLDALQVGTRLTIPIPHGSPVGTLWQGYLEGWRHEIHGSPAGQSHAVQLRVSDRQLTEPADRWRDIDPGITWAGTDPAMRWIDASEWKAAT